ncbi:MAG: aldo/keto reductase [Methanoregulaceae archaeon]|nr:aldo/keto reductase [Methanoregulaceae archaeon]
MLYRKVPKTGEELSILGYGYMRLPRKITGGVDEGRAIAQLRHAIDLGVNYVDTAPLYHLGKSEQILGKALADGYRGRINIATKLPPWSVRTSKDMDRILDSQLSTLHTHAIDYYLLHSLAKESWERLDGLGVLDFLDAAKREGRCRNAGFSFHGDFETFREIVNAYEWEFCQIQYNYLDERNQAGTEGLRYAAGKRLAVMVMEPLRGGNLAGRVPEEVERIWGEAPVKRSAAAWGLSWVWNHPEVTVALSGMNEEAHIEENIRVASGAIPGFLTAEEIALVERARDVYLRLMKVACTGCRYCMPCPSGVAIPECFSLYNSTTLFSGDRQFRHQYIGRHGGIVGDRSYAGLCSGCGRCEKICPQQIPIRDRLKDVSRTMEGRGFPIRLGIVKTAFQVYDAVQRFRRPGKRRSPEHH